MKQSLFVTIAILVIACGTSSPSAPTPVPTAVATRPWPDTWATEICFAIVQLGNATNHMQAAFDARAARHADTAAAEIRKTASSAKDAVESLGLAGAWQPGRSASVYLSAAAAEERKAASLFKRGTEAVDASLIKDSTAHHRKAVSQLKRAQAVEAVLEGKYGPLC